MGLDNGVGIKKVFTVKPYTSPCIIDRKVIGIREDKDGKVIGTVIVNTDGNEEILIEGKGVRGNYGVKVLGTNIVRKIVFLNRTLYDVTESPRKIVDVTEYYNTIKIGYDPITGKIIIDETMKYMYIVDPDEKTVVKITSKECENMGIDEGEAYFYTVPVSSNNMLVIVSGYTLSDKEFLLIGKVCIDDIIDARDNTKIEELGSWEELFRSNTMSIIWYYWWYQLANGKNIVLSLNPRKPTLLNINGEMQDVDENKFDGIPFFSPIYMGWLVIEETLHGYKLRICDSEINRCQDLGLHGTFIGSILWFYVTDTAIYGLTIGNSVPVIEFDRVNNRFRVVDFLTGEPIKIKIAYGFSRLQYNMSRMSIPIVEYTSTEINDWTSLPNPPNRKEPTIYIFPNFIHYISGEE